MTRDEAMAANVLIVDGFIERSVWKRAPRLPGISQAEITLADAARAAQIATWRYEQLKALDEAHQAAAQQSINSPGSVDRPHGAANRPRESGGSARVGAPSQGRTPS